MALTDTAIKNAKPGDKPAGYKMSDADGMYLLVKAIGKYWRLDYRYAEKRKTLALGVYPEIKVSRLAGNSHAQWSSNRETPAIRPQGV